MTELEKMNHVADALGRQAAEFQNERDDLRGYIAGISGWLPGEVLLAVKVKRLIEERDQLKAQLAQIDASGSLTAAIERAKRQGAVEALEQVSAYLEGKVPIRSTPRDEYGSGVEVGYQECIEHLDACVEAMKAANA